MIYMDNDVYTTNLMDPPVNYVTMKSKANMNNNFLFNLYSDYCH